MSDFKNSRHYGSRVNRARDESGWLSDEEFTRLGREEFRDFQQDQQGYRQDNSQGHQQGTGIDLSDILDGIFALIKLAVVCGLIYVIIRTVGQILDETVGVVLHSVFWVLARIPWKAVIMVIVVGGLYRFLRRRI